MANYYLDFVGLNTFIYEPVGYDPDNQVNDSGNSGFEKLTVGGFSWYQFINQIGAFGSNGNPSAGIQIYKNYL